MSRADRTPERSSAGRRVARRALRATTVAFVALAVLAPGVALGHAERHVKFPPGPGRVPKYRTNGPSLVVCTQQSDERIAKLPGKIQQRNERLLERCKKNGFRSIQTAIDHVRKR